MLLPIILFDTEFDASPPFIGQVYVRTHSSRPSLPPPTTYTGPHPKKWLTLSTCVLVHLDKEEEAQTHFRKTMSHWRGLLPSVGGHNVLATSAQLEEVARNTSNVHGVAPVQPRPQGLRGILASDSTPTTRARPPRVWYVSKNNGRLRQRKRTSSHLVLRSCSASQSQKLVLTFAFSGKVTGVRS